MKRVPKLKVWPLFHLQAEEEEDEEEKEEKAEKEEKEEKEEKADKWTMSCFRRGQKACQDGLCFF